MSDAPIAHVVDYVRRHLGNVYLGGVSASQVATLPHPPGSGPP